MIVRCPKCGYRMPPPTPLIRVCASCGKGIDRHHKYQTIMVSQRPPRFEFHHRHCDDPESYLSKGDRRKLSNKVKNRKNA